MKFLTILLLLIPLSVNALTEQQQSLLTLAYEIGTEIGYPETIQGILMQETLAGEYGNRIGDLNEPIGKQSYGVMQVKVATVRYTFNLYPEIKDQYYGSEKVRNISTESIIELLRTDDEACIVIASRYFERMLKLAKGHWSRAVSGYNGGWGTARKLKSPSAFPYVVKVNNRIKKTIRPFNSLQ